MQFYLNSVSSKCARGKSSKAGQPEVQPKIFLIVKNLKKNVTLQVLNFMLVS